MPLKMLLQISNVDRPSSARSPLQPVNRNAGFSLLEVLLAITVLIIIVLIISLVFQQAHSAWNSGTRKAGAETTLRSVMGILERDLSLAVDAEDFGTVDTSVPNVPAPNHITSASATFITLQGTNRLPLLVYYSYDGINLTRYTFAMHATTSANNWKADTQLSSAILNGAQALRSFAFYPIPNNTAPALPQRVEIEAHVRKQGTFGIVSGWSEGQNRPGHPEDKIAVNP